MFGCSSEGLFFRLIKRLFHNIFGAFIRKKRLGKLKFTKEIGFGFQVE